MLIMDYPRPILATNEDWGIVVPPFHTGCLGLIPDSHAIVSLMSDSVGQEPERGFCELLITPFMRKVGELVRLECGMVDRPGVVETLIAAVSTLGVSIVTKESTIVGRPAQHQISMILDFEPAWAGEDVTQTPAVELKDYGRNVPLSDAPLVRLFEAVAEHCGNLLLWDRDRDGARPHIRIRRIHGRRGVEFDPERTTVHRLPSPSSATASDPAHAPRSFHVCLYLPAKVREHVRVRLGSTDPADLSYFLFSETEERTLHAYLYRNDLRNLFHIGVYHKDIPKALWPVSTLVARSNFNIVTSLLRKVSLTESVWEALLDYQGKAPLPDRNASKEQQLRWVWERLRENTHEVDVRSLINAKARIGHPRYPMPRSGTLRELNLQLDPPAGAARRRPSRSPAPAPPPDDVFKRARERLASALQRRRTPQNPVVFVSYPGVAHEQAKKLKTALEAHGYCPIDGMQQEGQPILEDIVKKIMEADYFIGIWHHEGVGVSVWLPWECGVAMAADKPYQVVCSKKLPSKIRHRIDPGKNWPTYGETDFTDTTIPQILARINKDLPER